MAMKIAFGALSSPLHVQLGVPKEEAAKLQRLADAITLLAVQQILCESETHKARRRLVKRLTEDMSPTVPDNQNQTKPNQTRPRKAHHE